MLINRRNALMAEGEKSPWADVYTFYASDWAGEGSNWYSREEPTFYFRAEDFHDIIKEDGGQVIATNSNTAYVGSGFPSGIPKIPSAFKDLCFRIIIDGEISIKTQQDTFLVDNTYVNTGTGTRSVVIGFTNMGAPFINWKMNGNASASTFFPQVAPDPVATPPATLSGLFEFGVRPMTGGYACYTAYNGAMTALGQTRQASDFSTTWATTPLTLFKSMTSALYTAGKIRTLKIQRWAQAIS